MIEPHKYLLDQPEEDALLYKVMPSKNFFKLLESNCLHFKRVDTYKDDTKDSAQLPDDIEMHDKMFFEDYPEFSLYKYYNRCRSRTYASCFSLKNTKYIWDNYSYEDKSSICIVYNFGKLREKMNSFYELAQALYVGQGVENFLDINYGKVIYGDFRQYAEKGKPCPNPIEYAYFKDKKYEQEQEFRITLSASGAYEEFVLPDKTSFDFPESLGLELGLKELLNSEAVVKFLINEKASKNFPSELKEKLEKYGINVK